jgi:hypothetical protein
MRIMMILVRRSAPVLLAASAAATSFVAADPPGDPGRRSVAVGSEDTDQDNFRAAALRHGANATDPDHAGIWKAATPPGGATHGEFDNNDPFGLSAGVKIKADCSINWVDPDSGKRYCFSTATSLIVFLDAPHSYLALALKNWDAAGTGTHP